MRYRGHVGNRRYSQTGSLYSANRRFTPRTRTFDKQGNFLQTHRLSCFNRLLRRQTRRERRTLARTFKPNRSRTAPGNGISLRVSDGDDGVVKGCEDVNLACRQGSLYFACTSASAACRTYTLSHKTSLSSVGIHSPEALSLQVRFRHTLEPALPASIKSAGFHPRWAAAGRKEPHPPRRTASLVTGLFLLCTTPSTTTSHRLLGAFAGASIGARALTANR